MLARHPGKYQADGNASELDDVGVGDGIESADPGVKDGDESGYDDGRVEGNLEDDSKRCAWYHSHHSHQWQTDPFVSKPQIILALLFSNLTLPI